MSNNKDNKLQRETMESYQQNFDKYIEKTISMVKWNLIKVIKDDVLPHNKNAAILEIGTWTWRDADFIESLWYKVQRSDAIDWFIKYNRSHWKEIEKLNVLDFDLWDRKFELIYANAIFLHFTKEQFAKVLSQLKNHLIWEKKVFLRLKEGEGELVSNRKLDAPRYFKFRKKQELIDFMDMQWFKLQKISIDIVADGVAWINYTWTLS